MNIGDKFTVEITGYSHEGLGVARVCGQVLFVHSALLGEQLEVILTCKKKKIWFADIVSVLQSSPERIEAPCSFYDSCGGCNLQHMNYIEQLRMKSGQVISAMERLGGVDNANEIFEGIIPSPNCKEYRNKAVFRLSRESKLVFLDSSSHKNAAGGCRILFSEGMGSLLNFLESCLAEYDSRSFHSIMIRESRAYSHLQVIFVLNEKLCLDDLAMKIGNNNSSVKGVFASYAKEGEDTSHAIWRGTELIVGEPYLRERLGDLEYLLSPASFFQVNTEAAELLYGIVADFAELSGDETLWDLYCGIGSIGLFLADRCKEIIGVEIVEVAVSDACRNAELNNISNAHFFCEKAEEWIDTEDRISPELVILDPPRRGCDVNLLKSLGKSKIDRIIYVSCNPATLARDVKLLGDYGFMPTRLKSCDLFPQNYHVETVVKLTRLHTK